MSSFTFPHIEPSNAFEGSRLGEVVKLKGLAVPKGVLPGVGCELGDALGEDDVGDDGVVGLGVGPEVGSDVGPEVGPDAGCGVDGVEGPGVIIG